MRKASNNLYTAACLLSLFQIAKHALSAQTCTTTPPPTNGYSWTDSNPKSVYIDPNLPAAIKTAIGQASADFASQTGQSISVSAAGSSDPGVSQQDAIRFLNNPTGSPSAFAHTGSTIAGGNPHQQISATTSFNTGYPLDPTTPAYDPYGANAAQYVYDVVLHELGHAFGLGDTPVPQDANGNNEYQLQPAGASIMNGSVNTNDQGPHVNPSTGAVVNGGIGATAVQPCDKQQINAANPIPPPPTPSPSDGGGGDNGKDNNFVSEDNVPSDGDSISPCEENGDEEWDDSTNSLIYYSTC